MFILEEPEVSLVVTALLALFFLAMTFLARRGRRILLILAGLLFAASAISLAFALAA